MDNEIGLGFTLAIVFAKVARRQLVKPDCQMDVITY